MVLFGNGGNFHPAFDYVEPSVAGFLNPLEPEAAFQARLAQAQGPVRAFNVFAPPGFRLYGPGQPLSDEYLDTACRRAAVAGGKVIVIGAGRARGLPEDWTRAQAVTAMASFLRRAGDAAQRHGILLALEPLNTAEDNLITSVAQGAELVREAAHPAVRLLADQYHMDRENEPYQNILDAADLIVHTHTAVAPDRVTPRSGDRLPEFLGALKAIGYTGGVSVEGKWSDDFPGEAVRVAAYMRETWARLR